MDIFIFALTLILGFSLLIITLRMGIEYTLALFAGLGVLISLTITYPLEIFGWPILLAEAFYASFFLGTDIVTDNFGKEKAKKMVYTMLAGLVGSILFAKLIISTMAESDLAKALELFFGPISIVSLLIISVIIFFEQRIDIAIFSMIKNKTGEAKLWLRNCTSTIAVQTIDVLIVYPIFFYPIFGAEVWKLMLAAFAVKVLVAIFDTPVVYLSRRLLKK